MNSKTDVVNRRLDELLKIVGDSGSTGMTIKEMADAAGTTYHHVRRDLVFLVKRGRISRTQQLRDKAEIYTLVGRNNVPTVFLDDTFVKFTAFVDAALAETPTSSINLSLLLQTVLVGVTAKALAGNDDKLSYYPRELRYILIDGINRCERFISVAQSILDNERFWNEKELPYTLEVSQYNPEAIYELARKLLKELNSGD